MIFLVRNRTNTVHMLIKSTVDISGFSAILSSCGVCVAKTNLLGRVEFKFTPEQVALVGANGSYGTLVIYDSYGNQYLKYSLLFKLVEEKESYLSNGNQEIHVIITSPIPPRAASDSDITPTPAGGVTMEDVNNAISEAISEIGQTTIKKEPITITTPEGTTTITVQNAVQSVVEMQSVVEQVKETYVDCKVLDEDKDGQPDGEVLYLNSNKKSN